MATITIFITEPKHSYYIYNPTDSNMDIKPLGVCVNALASGLKSFFKLPELLM